MNIDIKKPSYGKAKEKLINATIACLMDNGAEGCSVRKISKQAGVSTGLINYHYSTLQDLIADAYKELALSLLERAVNITNETNAAPKEKLTIYLEKAFDNVSMNRRTLRAWIVFWGMIETSPSIRRAHDVSNNALVTFLENIFSELNQETPLKITPRLASIGLVAMVDGLWLEWSLQSDTFRGDEALTLCKIWINSIVK